MSREIDERIVQMKFDAQQFNRNIQTSIHNLNELKQKLDFKNAINGFEDLDKAARNTNISALGAAVDAVRVKFTLLDRLAIQTMDRMANVAIDTGKRLVESLSVDQISQGWGKYAEKTGSVQTIMAATAKQFSDTGKQMAFVNEQLDKLNWFTDETSYNFVDMTNNIGKFTSNNIDLDKSVTAMQGIANWAAISGANANEASRAMYNLSQAISSGALKLQDWMSIENANMGTAAFKEMAIQAGLAAKTLKKSGDKITTANGKVEVSVESFRNTLSEGWLSSEVLMSTLDQYGAATNRLHELYEETGQLTSTLVSDIDDYSAGTKTAEEISKDWGMSLEDTTKVLEEFQTETMQFSLKAFKAAQEAKTFADAIESVKDAVSTGWMKSFEYIFGDYEEAKVLWTDLANNLYDIFAAGGEARNEMLASWKRMGGRDLLVDAIWAGLSAILRILKPIKVAWDDVFGLNQFDLIIITSKLREFVINLNITEESMDKLRATARGFFSIFEIGWTAIKAAGSALLSIIQYLLPVGHGFLDVSASAGDFLTNLSSIVKETKIFDKIFGGLADVIKRVADVFFIAFDIITGGFKSLTGIESFSSITDTLLSLIEGGMTRFINVGHTFRTVLDAIAQSIIDAVPNANDLKGAILGLFKALSNPFSGDTFEKGLDFLNAGLFTGLILTIKKTIKSFNTLNLGKMFGSISDLFEQLGESIETFQGKLKADMLRSIAVSILILAGALAILASIDSDRLTGALAASVVLFGELFAIMKAFTVTLEGKKLRAIYKLGPMFIAISVAVLILSAAVKKLAELDWNGLAKGLSGVTVLMTELVASMIVLSKNTKRVTKGATGLILFAMAIRILASSVTKLAGLSWEELAKGLSGVGVLMAELAIFLKTTSTKFKITSGVGLIALSAAILLLTKSIEKLSAISTGAVVQGLISLGVILGEIALFVKSMSSSKHILSTAIAMAILGAAIKSLASSITLLGGNSIESLSAALFTLGVALGEIILAMKLIPKDILVKSASLLIIAKAISILSNALITMGDVASIANALILLGGSLFIISKAAAALNTSVAGAAAMLIFASALTILAPAIKTFGGMDLKSIGLALLSLIAMLATLGIAAKVLSPLTPAILKLSLAITAFSAAVALLGTGVVLLSTGLASLGASAIIGVGGLTTALLEIVNVIPAIAEGLAKGIISFANVIAEGAPAIANAVTTVIISLLQAISDSVPLIVDLVIDIITQIIAAIAGRIDNLREAGKMLFGGFSEGVSSSVKDIAMSIAVLVPTLVGAVKMLGGAKKMKKGAVKNIAAMVGVVAALGLLLIAFSHIPMGNIDNAITISAGIAILMPILAGSFAILSKFKGDVDMKTVAQFGIMSAIAVSVGALIAAIGMIPSVDKSIEVSKALAVLMPVLVGSFVILSKFSGNISMKTVAAFGIVTAIGVAAGAVVATIGSISGVEHATEAAKAIATLMIPLAVVVKILSGPAMANAGTAWSALAMLGAIVVALGGIAIGIGKLMQDPDFKAAIMDSTSGMEALGRAIGGFVGGIVGGLVEGALSFIPTVGTYLSDFMTNAEGFFEGAKNIPEGLGENIKDLAVALLALTAADVLNALANFAGSIFGVGSSDLAGKFKTFGEAITAFSDAIGESFDPEKVSAAANAGHALAELEGALPRQGGKLQDWLGSQDLGQFGERIKTFGTAIKDFAAEVDGITPEAVQGAADAGTMLADLEGKLPRQGGVMQTLFGSQSFDNFAPGLKTLGEGLRDFSNLVLNLKIEKMNTAAEAVKTLVDLENSIEASGGWGELFTGKSDFSSFGTHVTALGEALGEYSTSLALVNLDKIRDTNIVITGLLAIARTAGSVGANLSTFASNLRSFKISFEEYSKTANSTDTSKLEEVRAAIEDLLRLSEFTDAAAWISSVVSQANTMVSTLIEHVQSKYQELRKVGERLSFWLIAGVKKGMRENEKDVTDVAATLGKHIQEAFEAQMDISSPSAVMEEDGKWVVRGIAEGIKKDMSAEEAMAKKAENIKAAFEKAFTSNENKISSLQLDMELFEYENESGKDSAAQQAYYLAKQTEIQELQLQDKANEVKKKAAELEALGQLYGKDSEQYLEVMNEWKQAKLNLYSAVSEIDSYQNSIVSNDRDVMNAFAAKAKEYTEIADMMGWTKEEAMEKAGEAIGFDYKKSKEYTDYINRNREAAEMLGWSTKELAKKAEEATGYNGLKLSATNAAIDTAKYLEDALAQQTVALENNATAAIGIALSKVANSSSVKEAGEDLSENYAAGANNAITNSSLLNKIKAGGELLGNTLDWGTKKGAGENSPSWKAYEIGEYWIEGLVNGLNDNVSKISTISETEGNNLGEGYLEGLKHFKTLKSGMIETVAKSISQLAIDAIAIPSKVTQGLGNEFGSGYSLGISKQAGSSAAAAITLASSAIGALGDQSATKQTEIAGSNLGQSFGNSLLSKVNSSLETMRKTVSSAISKISSSITSALNSANKAASTKVTISAQAIGQNVGKGLAQGIASTATEVTKTSSNVAAGITPAMAKMLQVKSPSRLTMEIGNYVGLGLAKGLRDSAPYVNEASEDLAANTIDSLSYAAQAVDAILQSDEDYEPVITPVLDLDQLKNDAKNIPGYLNANRGISLNSANLRVGQIAASRAELNGQNGSQTTPTVVNNYDMTQNNYSPKALNRMDIYRQTRNQFARLKGATKV